ncbi:hypothetical protein A8139_08050 [Marinomonas primoryensis]|uniref:Uncharacterized protein n=1 Tax=Marinomonas primoryensis TaxID=178399 RepID=A0A2Z4PSD4_9GAMM|nr:hypothetical protein [Marinomonas primoryensis]AWX99953.1 hypothetical protein A8139_08050 [Marinomonas primoryensis]
MIKGAKAVGWLAVGLDGVIAADNIKEACTGDDTCQCEIVSYKETGGLLGSALLGGYGGSAGAAIATGIAIFLGVTTGGVAIIAIGFIGAGIGAYAGSKAGDSGGEAFGEMVYQKKVEYFK